MASRDEFMNEREGDGQRQDEERATFDAEQKKCLETGHAFLKPACYFDRRSRSKDANERLLRSLKYLWDLRS